MVITEVATSPGSHFLFVVLGAMQKSHLFSVFVHLGCDGWKNVFQIKRKDSEPENTH